MNLDILWKKFLENIQTQINSLSYETWFKETKLVEITDNHAKILVPYPIHKKHLTENYPRIVEETLNLVAGTNFIIEYVLDAASLNENEKNSEDTGIPSNTELKTNLNPKYTFETFVVGGSNKFAHAAALSVSEKVGKLYNPLFLYGKSGVGKTHLMHAIGNHILANSNNKVLYVTTDQFISDFTAINNRDKNGKNFDYINYFKNKYRSIDVLMIDDIQFLAPAPQTQQEFFNTFNYLYDDNKQIIISSDRSPEDLRILEDRLRTRFNWGLTANIYPPDFELRIEILHKKVNNHEIMKDISSDVIEYIANNCDSDVRQLEGAITRLFAYAAMMNAKVFDLDLAIEALKDYFNKSISCKNDIQKIQNVVCKYYNISVEDIKSKKRNANIAIPRQVAMYICRIMTDESYPKIGVEFGGKDHSTVIHSFEKIVTELKNNNELKLVIDKIKTDVNNY